MNVSVQNGLFQNHGLNADLADLIMGKFLKKGTDAFRAIRNGEFVDKSGLIEIVNATLHTERQFTCVSRPRRFGKSIGAKMLYAYYDQWCGDRTLFSDLQIYSSASFSRHFQRYPVLYIDMTDFVTRYDSNQVVDHIQSEVIEELKEVFPDVPYRDNGDLAETLYMIASQPQMEKFIMIIDEWDAILREYDAESGVAEQYINLLRGLFKSTNAMSTFAGVYMTGILPIKKYKTQSALNNFWEYSMLSPRGMSEYFGFTKSEVRALAEKTGNDFDELEKWYDGYQIGNQMSMFNPNSVIQAIYSHWCESYWASTGAYDAVAEYIRMNMDGLKDSIIYLLSGGRAKVNVTSFTNDLKVVKSKDDVLTVLIHLGYLSYDRTKQECYVPNREVAGELENAVKSVKWDKVNLLLDASEQLLHATLSGEAETVAKCIDEAHDENTSILSYNDENSLACVLSLAYYYARNDYIFHRELPTGKGFADLVLIPRKQVDSPAIVLELKCDRDAVSAIDQIKQKHYPSKIVEYTHNLLLVGINYDKKTKKHECVIEKEF